jgi:hypothetical protein
MSFISFFKTIDYNLIIMFYLLFLQLPKILKMGFQARHLPLQVLELSIQLCLFLAYLFIAGLGLSQPPLSLCNLIDLLIELVLQLLLNEADLSAGLVQPLVILDQLTCS